MEFFTDVFKLTVAALLSIAFIVMVLRFLTYITEPFFNRLWKKFKKRER